MKRVRHTFLRGVDTDTDDRYLTPQNMRGAVNIEIVEDGNVLSVTNMRGTTLRAEIDSGINPSSYNCLGAFECFGSVDYDCTGTYTDKRGLIIFLYDVTIGSRIIFFDEKTNTASQIYPAPGSSVDLDFPPTGSVDGFYSYTNGRHYFYWNDFRNPYRRIEISVSGCNTYQYTLLKMLSARPLWPVDSVEFIRLGKTGYLLCGTYQMAYRYYNTTTCQYSAISLFTNPIPVYPDVLENVGDGDVWNGGAIGEPTNASIIFKVNRGNGGEGFDSIQLVVAKNIDGLPKRQTVFMSEPRTDWYNQSPLIPIEYTGLEAETEINISEAVVEDLPLVAAKTIRQAENVAFVGNYKVRDFVFDNGDPTAITGAQTIAAQVAPAGPHNLAYKLAEHCVEKRGYFRGEVYAFGITYVDEFGNWSPVKAFDLSQFPATAADPTGNHGTSWAWKFPDRSIKEYCIFDASNNIAALGLYLEGVTNHPSWAKGFAIVRQKRIKDIIYQTPHIPCVAVQGVATHGVVTNQGAPRDYNGELDYFAPKVHAQGAARNLNGYFGGVQTTGATTTEISYASYYVQNGNSQEEEISNLAFAVPPEYIYNTNGEPYENVNVAGLKAKIIDAVAWDIENPVSEKDLLYHAYTAGSVRINSRAFVFKATKRENYYYTTAGYIVENFNQIDSDIPETAGFAVADVREETDIEYELPFSEKHPFATFPIPPFSQKPYQEVTLWRATAELAKQQGADSSIPPEYQRQFWTTSQNTRGLVLKMEASLEDFSIIMAQRRVENGDNYFPLRTWTGNADVYNQPITVYGPLNISINYPEQIPSTSGASSHGAYILNVVRGLGDDRYGDINNVGGEWIFTGIYQDDLFSELSEPVPYNLSVFGGDCFITKADIKIHSSHHQQVEYNAIEGLTDYEGTAIGYPKTGQFEGATEILSLYLESEVNTGMSKFRGVYPEVDNNLMNNYRGLSNYYYHPNYSNQNDLKLWPGEVQECNTIKVFNEGVVWSDVTVRGTVSNALEDTEGFGRIRINNQLELLAERGQLTKIVSLNDKRLYFIQERGVFSQPISVDELYNQEGNIIAVGTGKLIGTGGFYLKGSAGSQHIRSCTVYNDTCYFADAINRQVCFFSAQSGIRIISAGIMEKEFHTFLGSTINEYELFSAYDNNTKRLVIYRKGLGGWVFTNRMIGGQKVGIWETAISISKQNERLFGMAFLNDNLFWITKKGTSATIHTAFTAGNTFRGFFVDHYEDSEITVVCNKPDGNKTFDEIKINGINVVDETTLLVVMDDAQGSQLASISFAGVALRYGEYHNNKLRYIDNGRTTRFRGIAMEAAFKIVNSADKGKVTITWIEFGVRKSYK